eukprot:jgi/Tetstr1/463017/TSEL_007956.t1
MAVPAPPMPRATSSQQGGDALPGDDDAPGAPRQEAEEAVVEATDRAEGVVEASEAALAPPAPQPPAGHADLLVAMLTGALRAVAGGGHMHYHRAVPCPNTATVRAEFRHVRDAFHDATRAAVCEASEKARAADGPGDEGERDMPSVSNGHGLEVCRSASGAFGGGCGFASMHGG